MDKTIKYTSPNGYTGVMGGVSSMAVYDKNGKEVFHTGFRNIDTEEELKKYVDGFPEFREMLFKLDDDMEDEDDI